MADYLNIAGRVRTTASDGVAMEAQEVKDLNLNKSQQEINADVQTELGDRYTKEETYSREQLDELITTPDVNRVYVIATNLTTAVTDLLPATGSSDTLYNVGNWDGTQYDTTVYSIYGWDGTAYVCLAVRSSIGEVYDISANHPDGQGNPTPYADLTAALGTGGANVPVGIRRGGMSIKFIQGTVQSSDNKYVQYRLTADAFTTDITKWQNVGDFLEEKEHPIADNDVAGYLTDKNKVVIAKLMKNGSVEFLAKNSVDRKIDIIDQILDSGYIFVGIAEPTTNPETPSGKCFYYATDAGEYEHFGDILLPNGLSIITWDGESWNYSILVKLDDSVNENSDNPVTSGGVYSFIKSNTVEEYVAEVEDEDVAGYITDANKWVIAKVMKNGSVEWLVKTRMEISYEQRLDTIEELLSYVSTELPDSETNIIKFLTDNRGVVIATINNKGEVQFTAGGGFDGEVTHQQYVDFGAIKVLTDKRGSVIGWITRDGKVHIEDLEVNKFEGNVIADSIPKWLQPITNIAGGEHNSDYINDDTYDYVDKHKAEINIEGITKNTIPTLVLHDDDTYDPQIPSSYIPGATAETQPSYQWGGFASLLMPVLLAFNAKYGNEMKGKAVCGLAGEGQRIGLTSLFQLTDDFDGNLNINGQIINKIIDKEGWEVMCHSMTARYVSNSYLVNGLDSEFANSLLVGATYSGDNGLRWSTTTCYDTVTQKNYKVKQDLSGWDECPLHYAKPYLAVSKASNSRLVINPTYSVKYQVGTWFERGKVAGLKFLDRIGIRWGASHSIWHFREDMKYADVMFDSYEKINYIPMDSMVDRIHYHPDADKNGITTHKDRYNAYNQTDYDFLCAAVDEAFVKKGLIVLTSHCNEGACQNMYWDAAWGFNYPTRTEPSEQGKLDYYDANYPSEWHIPLKWDELMDMLDNEDSTYWTTPPQRLGIQSWADFYPCPGTTLAMLWDVLKYALDKGFYFASSKEALKMFGNKFASGPCIDQRGGYWANDSRLGSIPEENKSYCVIGVDGSIRYSSKNKNY